MVTQTQLRFTDETVVSWEKLIRDNISSTLINLQSKFVLGVLQSKLVLGVRQDTATEQIDILSNTEVSLFCNMKGMYDRPSHRADGLRIEGTFFLTEEGCQINVLDDRTVEVSYPGVPKVLRHLKQLRMMLL